MLPAWLSRKGSNLLRDALFQVYLSEHACCGLGDAGGLTFAVEDCRMNLARGAVRAVDVAVILGDHDVIISQGQQSKCVQVAFCDV